MSEIEKIKPPFPYFGGKSKVAPMVWKRFGDVYNYVEPFFGSGAVLFGRPGIGKIETVNDLDHFIANFWRAVQHDPEQVAIYADNPVFEDDLTARHIWLVKRGMPKLAERIPADPEYYDAKIAGWWVWGLCCWIAGGWCTGKGPWTEEDGQLVHLGSAGKGVNRQRIHLGDAGKGVNRQRIHLGSAGMGVNRPGGDLIPYFQTIAERLRNVRVCSGDWARVVTDGALSCGNSIGIFLDPPYSSETGRDMSIYREDSGSVAKEVLEWCVANGDNPLYRIALAGYEGEANSLEKLGWSVLKWKAGASYGNSNGNNNNSLNRHLERIWFSPACLAEEQYKLFK